MDSSKRKANPNPKDSASAPSLLFNTWLIPLFWRGWKKPVEVEDLYDPVKRDRSGLLGDQLGSRWEAELERCRGDRRRSPSLISSLLRTFGGELLYLAALLIVQTTCSIAQSFLLGKLLAHFRPNSTVSREEAMYYTGGMVGCAFVELLLRSKYEVSAFHTGLRIRAACCALIYRKSLKLSVTALGEMASGQAVNLLSNDVSRFDLMMVFLHYMWVAPLVTAVITCLLYRDGGIPALFGLAVMILIVLCQAYIGRLSSMFRRRIAFRTDERIRLVNEVISGINVIKMYAWEKPFIQLMRNARRCELRELRKTSMVRGIYMTFHLCANRMSLFCAVVALYMFGFSISADKVFVFISYFNILTWILGGMFVRGCAEVSECYVSVQRIRKYLMNEEYKDGSQVTSSTSLTKSKESSLVDKLIDPKLPMNGNKNVIRSFPQTKSELSKNSVVLSNVVAKWNSDANEPTLDGININTLNGQLLAIIGPVGAGKSSVLQSILGELPVSEGSVEVNGKTSYASQDPWVFAATVKQNILFGAPFDRKRYEKVVKACALQKDFEQFPDGDMTVVGERGVSLSGGQRARVNLARAVYRDADIYLLDDPLSAVDTHVGRHLYDECIRRYLKNKTVILVTHQLQYLKDADCILLMSHGTSLASGTYQEIISSGIDYGKLLLVDDDSKPTDPRPDDLMNSLSPKKLVSMERKRSTTSSYTSSMHSIHSNDSDNMEDQPPQATSPLVDKLEATSKGVVKGSLYLHYFKSGGSIFLIFVVGLLFLLTQIAVSFTDYWIAFWTKLEDSYPMKLAVINVTDEFMSNASIPQAATNMSTTSHYFSSNGFELTSETCLYIYATIVSCSLLLCVVRTAVYYFMVLRICDRLHKSMFQAVIGTTMRFFDTNPSGRILNRFAKDVGSVDEILPKIILDAVQIMLNLTGAVCLTVLTNYFLIIPLIFMGIIFRFVQKFYLRTAKCMKRLEGIVRSPVFSHLNATLQGMVTIRAFGAEELLKNEFDKHQDLHSSAWYLHLSGSNAFGLTLELSSFIYNIIVLVSIFVRSHESSGGEVGLAITQCIVLNGYLQWGVRQSAEVANNMMSAERVLEYTQLLPEGEKPSAGLTKVGNNWPSKGSIEMDHVYLRYAPSESPVLQDLSICIKPGEKIGIVGRTGAGKSSLITTLFRMAVVEGRVIIDDIDTSDVTLARLRSSISIIPQDPVLFSGTMRRNLDPFQEYPDEKLWTALSEVELKQLLTEQEGLDTRVLEGGSNFSVGQRQLVCLARAILRANRILMMDEATANVDPQTDQLIQSTIREKFKACTVLTVAHRLNTVIDSDRVLVMESGSIAEFDHPFRLLEKPGGVFRSMVYKMGAHGAEQLYQSAKNRFESLTGST